MWWSGSRDCEENGGSQPAKRHEHERHHGTDHDGRKRAQDDQDMHEQRIGAAAV